MEIIDQEPAKRAKHTEVKQGGVTARVKQRHVHHHHKKTGEHGHNGGDAIHVVDHVYGVHESHNPNHGQYVIKELVLKNTDVMPREDDDERAEDLREELEYGLCIKSIIGQSHQESQGGGHQDAHDLQINAGCLLRQQNGEYER